MSTHIFREARKSSAFRSESNWFRSPLVNFMGPSRNNRISRMETTRNKDMTAGDHFSRTIFRWQFPESYSCIKFTSVLPRVKLTMKISTSGYSHYEYAGNGLQTAENSRRAYTVVIFLRLRTIRNDICDHVCDTSFKYVQRTHLSTDVYSGELTPFYSANEERTYLAQSRQTSYRKPCGCTTCKIYRDRTISPHNCSQLIAIVRRRIPRELKSMRCSLTRTPCN